MPSSLWQGAKGLGLAQHALDEIHFAAMLINDYHIEADGALLRRLVEYVMDGNG